MAMTYAQVTDSKRSLERESLDSNHRDYPNSELPLRLDSVQTVSSYNPRVSVGDHLEAYEVVGLGRGGRLLSL